MSADLYRMALDEVPYAVLIYDRSLHVTLVNERAREIYGVPEEGYEVGLPFEHFVRFHAERGGFGGEGSIEERVAARIERARSFEPYRSETRLYNGRIVVAEGRPVGEDHFVVTYTDITALRRAEEAVRLAHSRYAQLFEATNEGWWFVEPDGTTIDVNPAMCTILGRSRDDVMRRSFFEFVDEENRAVLEKQLELRRSGIAEPYELTLLRADGSDVTCIVNPAPIYDDDGRHVGSIGLWTDVTDLKRAIRELAAAELRAQDASRAKSQFLSTMSHELRTPLNAILGFAQLLGVDPDEPLSERQEQNVGYITSAGRHLLDLITDVLDLARIEAGNIELDVQALDVGALVADCVRLVEGLASQRDVGVEVGRPAAVTVQADAVRIRQALLNLLSNAIKYNSVGGAVAVEVSTSDAGTVRISVADTGPGIPPALAAGLFEPFNRLGAERGEIEGTGIGLSITRQLVEAMGGTVGFGTEVGRGSRFWIELPGG